MKAHYVGAETGDFEFAFLDASIYSAHMFYCGSSLPVIERQLSGFAHMTEAKNHTMLSLLKPFRQLAHNLMGLAENPLVLSGEVMEDVSETEHAEETKNTQQLMCLRVHKQILGYMFGDFKMASQMNKELESANDPPGMDGIFCLFFRGLTDLATARSARGRLRWKSMKCAKKRIKFLKRLSRHSPHNCLAMTFLLQAEYASVSGKNAQAYEKYVCAGALANDSGYGMVKALANECAARHLFALGEKTSAATYFKKACTCYEEWGAKAKLEHLESEMKKMFDEENNCQVCM